MSNEENEPLDDVDLLTEMVKALVRYPDHVKVIEEENQDGKVLEISVADRTDRGRVIGYKGINIESIRALFRSIGTFDGKRKVFVNLESEDRAA